MAGVTDNYLTYFDDLLSDVGENDFVPPDDNWQEEGWESYRAKERHYVRLVDDLLQESKEHHKQAKQRWMTADKRLELEKFLQEAASPTRTDIALIPLAVEKAVSLRLESAPRPQAIPRQPTQEEMIGGLNYFMQQELEANNFDLLLARVAVDCIRFGLGCIKQTIDPEGKGPFAKDGRIVFTKVDPRSCWPDPFAKSWRWEDMTYLIVAEARDLSEVRELFPIRGCLVKGESLYSLKREVHESDELQGFGSTGTDERQVGERERVLLKELWLKDNRRHEVQQEDDDGNPLFDDEGNPLTKLVKKYPNGRLIITSNGRLLLDCANPFKHGQPPYTFIQNRISTKLFTFGDIELLLCLEDKLNTIQKDMLRNARVNINAPWIVDNTAFDSSEKFKNLTNEEGLVITKNQGSDVLRLPPAELPQFVFPLLDWITGIFNDTSGVSNIMQGSVARGSQLSSDAIQQLQGSSSGNLKIKQRLLENGLEHFGHLLAWNIFQLYPSQMQVEMRDPSSGESKVLKWNSDEKNDEWSFDIQVSSSLPGAKAGVAQQAMTMYDHNLIDRQCALDLMQFPGRGVVIKRIQEREEKLAALGIEAKQRKSSDGRAGRKFKDFPM